MKKYLSEALVDTHIEVKILALNSMYSCCEIIDTEEINNSIIPCLNTLTNDTETVVRVRLASNICKICPLLGKKNTNDFL